MGSVVLSTLSIFLGLFFLFVGTLKVSPDINREMHRDIIPNEAFQYVSVIWYIVFVSQPDGVQKKSFAQYAKVFPLARTLGFKVPSKWLRLIVGWSEVLSGTTLVFIPGNSWELTAKIESVYLFNHEL
ncbi:TMEM35, partial [Cordylochernes scorpioides]